MKKFLTIITSAGLGYITGLLVAPKPGKETRKELSVKADKIKEVALSKAEDAKVVYNESAEKVKHGAGEVAEEATVLAHKAKKSADNIGKEMAKFGTEAKRHLGKATKSTAETAKGVGKSFGRLK